MILFIPDSDVFQCGIFLSNQTALLNKTSIGNISILQNHYIYMDHTGLDTIIFIVYRLLTI